MDLNGDGHADLLSGSYSRHEQPMAGLFQVLWGQADGTFKKAAVLMGTDDKPLVIPAPSEKEIVESICTRPTAVDWDSDGDLDLVVGNFAGRFYLFTGEGAGKFAPATQPIMAGASPLKVEYHADPCVVDWDGDGDLDVLSGSSQGGVEWAENTAGARKTPQLTAFTPLIPTATDRRHEFRPHEVTRPAGSTRVWVADVNGDRKLDLLVGDSLSLISPANGLSDAEFLKRYGDWKAANAKLSEQTVNVTDEEKLRPIWEQMSKHYEARKEFMVEDRTGFVWLYLQK